METTNKPTNPPKKENKNSKFVLIGIIIIAVLAAGWFAWDNSSIKAEYEQLAKEKAQMKAELESELDSLMSEHTMIKEQYGELSDSLMVKDSLIVANAKEIKSLLNYKWEYYKIKKKLSRLQTVSQNYVRQMDSLYTVNTVLTEENMQMN